MNRAHAIELNFQHLSRENEHLFELLLLRLLMQYSAIFRNLVLEKLDLVTILNWLLKYLMFTLSSSADKVLDVFCEVSILSARVIFSKLLATSIKCFLPKKYQSGSRMRPSALFVANKM